MIPLDAVLDAYIDANIMLALGALLWAVTRAALAPTRMARAFTGQLQLLYAMLALVAAVPFAMLLVQGMLPQANLSDLVLAQYLDGRFAMAPTTFERLLMLRDTLVRDVTTLHTAMGTAVALILALGIAFGLARMLHSLIRLHRMIGQSYLLRRSGRVDIRLTDSGHIPFSTRGVWRYHVVIPSAMLARPDDLRIALAHELQHLRQGDLLWELALELLRPLFTFNPAMGYLKHQVERCRELACDQGVMRRRGVSAQRYASALLRVCADATRNRRLPELQPSVALVQLRSTRNTRFLRQRVAAMMRGPAPADGSGWVAALLLPLAVTIGLAGLSLQPSGDWSQDRLMLSTIVNLERMAQRSHDQ